MKKTLVALATLAVAGTAPAQSSVTLFGLMDATVKYGEAKGPGSASKTQLGSGGFAASRLGFRGTEDLGGGLAATFWLEGTLLMDSGSGFPTTTNNQQPGLTPSGPFSFDRRSTVSLAGPFGELRLGRDFSPQFWNIAIDPFGVSGVGIPLTMPATSAGAAGIVPGTFSTSIRASNGIDYFLPPKLLGGVFGQAMYYLGENPKNGAATEEDGTGYGVRVGYASGPFTAAIATSNTHYASGSAHQSNVGAKYDFGVANLMAHYSRDHLGATSARGWLLGTIIPVGPHEIKVAYSRYRTDLPGAATDPLAQKLALGYVYNFSKRTAWYVTYATVRNKNGSSVVLNNSVAGGPNRNSSGVDIGLRSYF